MPERWQEVWHRGIAPQLSDAGLEALAVALRDDDPRLQQGATTMTRPNRCKSDALGDTALRILAVIEA